jgi:hypothetical protein
VTAAHGTPAGERDRNGMQRTIGARPLGADLRIKGSDRARRQGSGRGAAARRGYRQDQVSSDDAADRRRRLMRGGPLLNPGRTQPRPGPRSRNSPPQRRATTGGARPCGRLCDRDGYYSVYASLAGSQEQRSRGGGCPKLIQIKAGGEARGRLFRARRRLLSPLSHCGQAEHDPPTDPHPSAGRFLVRHHDDQVVLCVFDLMEVADLRREPLVTPPHEPLVTPTPHLVI